MAKVSPEAAALIRAGRAAFRPTAANRDRVFSALSERLGSGMFDPPPRDAPMSAQGAGRFGRLGWRLWPFVGVPALGLGLALILGSWDSTTPSSIATVAAPLSTALVAPAEVAASEPAPSLPESSSLPTPPPEDRAPRPPSSGGVRPRGPSRADGLLEEVRLLSSAGRDLNRGNAEDALRALAEHERRFPTGALAEERLATRVQALCMGGRRDEAKPYLAQLAQAYPRSPHLQRARAACSVAADSGP